MARAIWMSVVLDTIPRSHRRLLGLSWFPERAGMVETESGHGWLFRETPDAISRSSECWLVPAFSLISRRGSAPPLVVELIESSGLSAEHFVIERLLLPYVNGLAYLLFEQGVEVEAHAQNLLFVMKGPNELQEGIVLRDLADATLHISLRLAKGGACPVPPAGLLPQATPFSIIDNAADYRHNRGRSELRRGTDVVEVYGLLGFVWSIQASLARYFPDYDRARVQRTYLQLWRDAAVGYLNVRPGFRTEPRGIATDEAIALFLRKTDWRALGSVPGATLPSGAEALRVERRVRRRSGPVFDRLECAWGELYLLDGLPAFFRPAF